MAEQRQPGPCPQEGNEPQWEITCCHHISTALSNGVGRKAGVGGLTASFAWGDESGTGGSLAGAAKAEARPVCSALGCPRSPVEQGQGRARCGAPPPPPSPVANTQGLEACNRPSVHLKAKGRETDPGVAAPGGLRELLGAADRLSPLHRNRDRGRGLPVPGEGWPGRGKPTAGTGRTRLGRAHLRPPRLEAAGGPPRPAPPSGPERGRRFPRPFGSGSRRVTRALGRSAAARRGGQGRAVQRPLAAAQRGRRPSPRRRRRRRRPVPVVRRRAVGASGRSAGNAGPRLPPPRRGLPSPSRRRGEVGGAGRARLASPRLEQEAAAAGTALAARRRRRGRPSPPPGRSLRWSPAAAAPSD